MREQIYTERLNELIRNYRSDLPLALYLRQEFNKRRNMGARDRRRTREDVFSYFRIGKNIPELSIPERTAVGAYLCSNESNRELEHLIRNYSAIDPGTLSLNLEKKLNEVKAKYPSFDLRNIFPFTDLLSPNINRESFTGSFLLQPLLWIRVKKYHLKEVIEELNSKKIPYKTSAHSELALAFPNGSAIHLLQSFQEGKFEVQDLSSQRSAAHFELKAGELWLDACAGSGGKSLQMLDRESGIRLQVSDLRESTLINLKLRAKKSGVYMESVEQIDWSADSNATQGKFDGILADVPCSGSGTWARSPEILCSFDPSTLNKTFVERQRKIVHNLTGSLKDSGRLVYITCSVFRAENEENVTHFEASGSLQCITQQYIEGAEDGADTMFLAIFEKKKRSANLTE